MSIVESPRYYPTITSRQLATLGIFSPLPWIAAALLAGSIREGYSFAAQAISALGFGPNAWLLNTGLIASGALFGYFGSEFVRSLPEFQGKVAARWLLACFGAGFGLLGVFNQGTPGSLSPVIHLASFGMAVLFLVWALGLIGSGLLPLGGWGEYARYTRRTRVAVMIITPVMLMLFTTTSRLSPLALAGAAEWALFLTMSAWFVASARRLKETT